ncbi:MAG: lipoprotein-releasing ABC transporter permease subunit [Deltaproteobacteria bacterium]|nr:lipoprotein-releasing ABC transporter permease subunit [Deltaproteobacteria bacterium]MBW2305877.1 lipoprotein-releasing ABC transporter permease subunit [Deltaproteobacteria bacterium]
MRFELFIGLRYLRAKRKQTFISIISVISIVGVMVGVMALVTVLAVMNGFQEDIRNKILGITSHVLVLDGSGGIREYQTITRRVETVEGVVAATPFVLGQAMLSTDRAATGVVVRGIDPETASRVVNLEINLKEGTLDELHSPEGPAGVDSPEGMIIGRELENLLGVSRGDEINMISPTGVMTPVGMVPRMRKFKVTGVFESGMYEYDSTLVFLDLRAAQDFFDMPDRVTGIEVRVQDIYQADEVSQRVARELGFPYWTKDWMQMNKNLFSALKLEKIMMFILLALIIMVAAFNIIGTLTMVVMEKTRDIAILKSMGATARKILNIFIIEGVVVGVMGTALGIMGGYGLCLLLARYPFPLPRDVYPLSYLPVKPDIFDFLVVAASAIVISFAATIYPSWHASKLQPAEALRYE